MDPRHPEVREMVMHHLAHSAEHTPSVEDRHALDPSGLAAPNVTMFGLHDDTGALVAIAALKQLTGDHVELKSMHTIASRRGAGLGNRLLQAVLTEARRQGYREISLETGTQHGFAAARRLYERAGFTECPPFAEYALSSGSVFYTRSLDPIS